MNQQASFFDEYQRYHIGSKKIRLIELFAGIGAQAKALERLGVDFEHYRVCEFDKYAIKSYNAIHVTNFEPSDICKLKGEDLGIVETEKYEYIMTYSFPCQDISNAGLQRGFSRDSGTRSGLLWEVERLLKEMNERPQIFLMENVPGICGTQNERDFNEWLRFLESIGYSNFYKILNAKDYGVPQNRKRCYMVSILGEYWYDFPEGKPLTLRLKDLLEKEVDEKYYLSDAYLKYAEELTAKMKAENKGFVFEPTNENGIAKTIKAQYQFSSYANFVRQGSFGATGVIKCEQLGTIIGKGYNDMNGRVYSDSGLSSSIRANSGGHNEIKIIPTGDFRIRKLTPKECFRLMDFDDEDVDKCVAAGVSNSQLYKQAGNSIVVAVLEGIFRNLL